MKSSAMRFMLWLDTKEIPKLFDEKDAQDVEEGSKGSQDEAL